MLSQFFLTVCYMDVKNIIKNLHPLEIKVLLKYSGQDELTSEKLQKELEYKEGHANQAFSWLSGKELLKEIRRTPHTFFEITEMGRKLAETGTVEERMVNFLKDKGAHTMPEIAAGVGLEQKDVGSAFGPLVKDGVLKMNEEKKVEYTGAALPERIKATMELVKKACSAEGGLLNKDDLSAAEVSAMDGLAKKRGAADSPFKMIERETVFYKLQSGFEAVRDALKSAGVTGNEIGEITPKMLASGDWKNGTFRGYNIAIPPARIIPGRTNPYVQFLESVKDKLWSLGFQEFDGPLVETEFWNGTRMSPERTFAPIRTIPSPSRLSSVFSAVFGISRVIFSGPSFVSRISVVNSLIWIEVYISSFTTRREIRTASS